MKKRIYNIRASNINEKKRTELLFEEINVLEKEVENKIKGNSRWSTLFRILNTLLGFSLVICAGTIMILEGISGFINNNPDESISGFAIAIFILGGVIFVVAGSSQLFKFSDRGYHYRQGTIRLKRIRGQLRELIYMSHNYKIEEVLAFISSHRAEIDEIDLDLYKSSMTGDVNIGFDGDINVSDPKFSNSRNNSELHIVVDSSESPHSSPRKTPKIGRNSPVTIRIETGNSKDDEEN